MGEVSIRCLETPLCAPISVAKESNSAKYLYHSQQDILTLTEGICCAAIHWATFATCAARRVLQNATYSLATLSSLEGVGGVLYIGSESAQHQEWVSKI